MPGETVGRDLVIPSPPRRKVYLRIEELPDPDGDPKGRRVLLARPSAHAMKLAQRTEDMEIGTPAHVTALYDLAEALMPQLSRDDVERVSAETVHYIFALFNQPLAVLEEIAKNAAAPLAEARKGSNSPTPSPIRVRGSRKRSRSRTAS